MNNNKDRDLTHQLNSALPLNNMTPLNEGERFIRIDSVTVMNGDNNDVVTENGTSDGVLFTVRGTALPNEIFFIYVNETRFQVRADREGNWVSHHLPRVGDIEIKVAIPLTDLSDSFNFTRTEAPIETRPIIHEIYDDEVSYAWEFIDQAATTSDADPIVRGYALAGSEVKVLINGQEVTSTVANDFNNWSLNLPLQEGRNVITVITNGEESEPWEVFYQPAAEPVEPVAPDLAITFMRDVMSGEQIDPNGAATSNSVQLSGTGPADQRLMAYAGNQFIGYVFTDMNGNWSQMLTIPQGNHELTVRNGTERSEAVMITVPAPVPVTPEIHSIWADENTPGLINNGGSTDDNTPQMSGIAGRNATVEVWVNGQHVDTLQADDLGNWNYSPTLSEGMNRIHLVTQGVASETVEVHYAPPAPPVDEPLSILRISDFMTGDVIDPNGSTSSTEIRLSGVGPASRLIEIWSGDTFIKSVPAGRTGTWQTVLTLPHGENAITLRIPGQQSEPVTITVTAPALPVPEIAAVWADENTYGNIENGGNTDDATPQIQGVNVGRYAMVEIWLNGQHIETIMANRAGDWTYSPTLSEGLNQFQVKSQGVASEIFEVNYTPAPEVELAIRLILDGNTFEVIDENGSLSGQQVRISGTGPAGAMLSLWSGDKFITDVIPNAQGNWTYFVDLLPGENSLTLRSENASSAPWVVNAPAASLTPPEIHTVWADENNYGQIVNGGTTDDATPVISGGAGKYASVEIWLNGQLVDTTAASVNGSWSYTPTLREGLNQIVVKTQGIASEIFEIHFDPAATPAPAIVNVWADEHSHGQIVNGGNTDDATPQLRGINAGPFAEVEIWINGRFVTTTQANNVGFWSYSPTLSEGLNQIVVKAGGIASEPFDIHYAPPAPLVPVITSVWADDNTYGEIAHGDTTDDDTLFMRGHNVGSFAEVEIWQHGRRIDTVQADNFGNWSYNLTLGEGRNQIVVKSQGVSSEPYDIYYAPPAPPVPVITSVWADENSHGHIGNGDSTDDATPYIRGHNVGSFAEVEIWLHGRRIDTVQADNFGNWSYHITLSEGRNQIVVKSQGVSSEPYDIYYAPPAPPVPVITSVWADENSHGHIGNGDSTDDATPYIRGHNVGSFAEVEIWLHGRRIDTVQADNFGNWSYNLTLREGRNQIVVKSQGVSSEPYDIYYASPAPPVPVITSVWADENSHGHIGNGDSTDDATPYIRGHNAGSFAEVEIWQHGRRIDTVQADNFGNWSYHLTLREGRNQIVVKSQGVSSEPYDIYYAPPAVPEQPALAITQMQDILTGNPVDPHGTITGRNVILSGTGPRGTIVQIWIGDQLVNNVYSGSDGRWSTPIYLLEGENSITVRHAGNQSEAVIITTQNPPPPALEITELLADENGAGPILSGDTTQDATPQLSGIAGANMLVQIWINDQLVRTVNANRYGEWRYTPTLEEGLNQIVVKSMGVTSEPFEVIYEPLVVPVEPEEPELAITGIRDLATGQILEPNASPESAEVRLFGKGPANQWVQIWLGDTEIGIALTNGQGEWDKAIDLQLGDNMLTVRVGDQQSEPVLVNVPALNLPAPEISYVYADEYDPKTLQTGEATNDDTVQIRGTASHPFAFIEIWINGDLIETKQANYYGAWDHWATLSEGQNSIVVVSRGVSSEPFVVDYQPFEGPATTPAPEIWSVFADDFTQVQTGDITQSATPQLSGIAEAHMRVQLWVNDVMIDSTYADRNGLWYFNPRLTEGVNRIMVKSNGAESDVFELTYQPEVVPVEPVDPVLPVDPVIPVDPANPELSIVYHNELSDGNTTTAERQSVFSGKAPAGSMITLYLNDQLVTTIEVASTGDWIVSTALFDGENSLRIGLDGQFSEAVAVTVQGSPAPQILIAQDDHGVAWQLQNNAFTDDAIPQLRGVSAPNAIIQVYVGGQHLGSAQADMSGIWQVDINLNPGRNEIYVVENGVASENFYLTLEDAPVITGLFADGEMHENGGAAGDAELVLHGIAQPGATVEIYDSHSSLPIVITADANGNWSHTVSALVGENTYFAVSRGQWSEAFYFNYIPDLAEPAQPEQPEQAAFPIDMPENIEQYLNVPYITSAYDSVGTMPWLMNSGSWTDDAQPELYGGGARPNVIITILDGDNNVIGSTRTNSKGDWRFTPKEPLSPGQWEFSAANEYGNSGSTFTVNIRDLDPAPNMIAYDDVGDYRGVRPSGSFIDDAMPSFHGGSNPNKLISLYDQDNQLIATTTSNWNGSWTINIETPLLPGTHSFVARDEDGKSSDSLVLNIKTSDDAPWPEISSLLADGDAMLFAAQTESDDQDSFVALTISEADMAHSSLHDALSSDMVANTLLSIELLDEHQSLTQG